MGGATYIFAFKVWAQPYCLSNVGKHSWGSLLMGGATLYIVATYVLMFNDLLTDTENAQILRSYMTSFYF